MLINSTWCTTATSRGTAGKVELALAAMRQNFLSSLNILPPLNQKFTSLDLTWDQFSDGVATAQLKAMSSEWSAVADALAEFFHFDRSRWTLCDVQ